MKTIGRTASQQENMKVQSYKHRDRSPVTMDVFLESALSAEKKLQWKKENESIQMSSHFTDSNFHILCGSE